MLIRTMAELESEGRVISISHGRSSAVRLLTRSDGVGFSVSEARASAGESSDLWYKNHLYSVNGISQTIPDPGLFRNRLGNPRFARHRLQDAGIITSCVLLLAHSPAFAKEKTDVDIHLLSLGCGGLGSAAWRPALQPC